MVLTAKHKENIAIVFKEFSKWLLSDEGKEWDKVIEERITTYSPLLSQESIRQLSQENINKLIIDLWASLVWTNKDYLVDRIWKDSTLEKFKSSLSELLYGNASLQERYDSFQIKGLGIASITEIMILADFNKYPLFNNRARRGLIFLGFDDILPFLNTSSPVRGKHYIQFKEAMDLLNQELNQLGYKYNGYFGPDILLHYISMDFDISEHLAINRHDVPISNTRDFDHDEAIDSVLELGAGLGFEVASEQTVGHGARVDAAWKIKIANLGVISYIFEVHRRGSRDSAILNLQKAQQDSSVQKLIIVSTKEEIENFKNEIRSLPESFRNAVSYLEVTALNRSKELITELKNKLQDLNLLR